MIRLSFADARHLTVRTGLGEEWTTIKKREGRPREEIINQLIRTHSTWTKPVPRSSNWEQWKIQIKRGGEDRELARRRLRMEKQALQEWWMDTMLETQNPLIERMVMFWHNHFTSSLDKVNQPSLILKQNQLFRRHALGNFRTLLHEVARDPAMMVYLDCDTGGPNAPNENFARELMELYTIGEGKFTEDDVRAAAIAFTGWTVDRERQKFTFRRDKHDYSPVKFLGVSGVRKGQEVLDILLSRPETAEHIARKFWREFISDKRPDEATIKAWAGRFRGADYDIAELLKAVLTSKAFWTPENRASKVKSPVELLVGTLRTLPLHVPVPAGTTRKKRLTDLCHSLGQKLFVPPNPAGWPGGNDWIDTDTLNGRKNMLANLTNIESNNKLKKIPLTSVKDLSAWLLARKPINTLPSDDATNREKVNAILLDSTYQLT